MPKNYIVGNGTLTAAFDEKLHLRDFHFPFVGLEDHTTYGNFHRIGIWTEGKFSWLSEDPNWHFFGEYKPDSLVARGRAENRKMNLSISTRDFIPPDKNILIRKIKIYNHANYAQEVKLFFHHDFYLYGDKKYDNAQWEPALNGILHYRQRRYFLVGGEWESGEKCDQYTTGKSQYQGKEGTFRDAEDGVLSQNPIEHGSVDSTMGFSTEIPAGESRSLFLWICAGKNHDEVESLQNFIIKENPEVIKNTTESYWRNWAHQNEMDFGDLSEEIRREYFQSLLVIRTQTDSHGAIIATTDTDIMEKNRDAYNYCWPRDGAFVTMTLIGAGYEDLAEKFFGFCREIFPRKKGYFLQKYNPDGSLGSTWHPKITENGEKILPIQEDETALVLFALGKYAEKFEILEEIAGWWDDFLEPMADFLVRFVDPKTELPEPSFDLWERQRGVFTFTSAITVGALFAAAHFAEQIGHRKSAQKYEKAALKMQKSILENLFSFDKDRFVKRLFGDQNEPDFTLDASLLPIWQFGLLPADDPRMHSTVQQISKKLASGGGLARFEEDDYFFDFSQHTFRKFPGNPWIVTTAWLADWEIENAKNRKSLKSAREKIEWMASLANRAGIFAEQFDPKTHEPRSVAPLTWSHAAFCATVQRYCEKFAKTK